MNKPKFTPGPWKINGNQIREDLSVFPKTPKIIALLDGEGWNSPSKNEFAANARLIAAAPDMYQVLRSIQEMVNGAAFHDEKNRLLRWNMVDQVLRMVEGKEDV